MKRMLLILVFFTPSLSGFSQSEVVGDWKGTLAVSGIELSLIFHITDDDGLKATMDSPDQGAFGIPCGYENR